MRGKTDNEKKANRELGGYTKRLIRAVLADRTGISWIAVDGPCKGGSTTEKNTRAVGERACQCYQFSFLLILAAGRVWLHFSWLDTSRAFLISITSLQVSLPHQLFLQNGC